MWDAKTCRIGFLGALTVIGAQASQVTSVDAQEVANIANVRGASETVYFRDVRGWRVVVGSINGQAAYCAATQTQAGTEIRFGYGGGQWQMAVPYSARRGDYAGQIEIDGKSKGMSGISDGKWTFAWLTLGERDALMNGQQVILEVGKASLDFSLAGASAAIQKVEECVTRRVAGGDAVSAAPEPAPPPPVQATSHGFARLYAKIDGWEINRVSKDRAGRQFSYCSAFIITDTETGLRFTINDQSGSFGFSGYASLAIGNAPKIDVWFDNQPKSSTTYQARVTPDHTGWEWLMITESNSEPGLMDDSFQNARTVHFGYPVDGQPHVQTFSLKSTNKVITRMIECRDKR